MHLVNCVLLATLVTEEDKTKATRASRVLVHHDLGKATVIAVEGCMQGSCQIVKRHNMRFSPTQATI